MLYLKKNVTEKQIKKYGFKRCRKPYNELFYLCIARGVQVIFIGDGIFVQHWMNDDPRIHSRPNCKYKDDREVLDVIYDLITDGLIERRRT
ncbi:hypothetical protein [Candidatus Stoquefichus sp. SB1]|uniref:hypothetical protein n=1 Tax=Candidatus Stoquefichus sp. SB1 TaxID=1658109 RepID=UPI00067F0F8D|nr:hypothetical protein [Candidatus Stoquefichus sp. SB1]